MAPNPRARHNPPMDAASPTGDQQQRDAFVEHIDDAASGTFEIAAIALSST